MLFFLFPQKNSLPHVSVGRIHVETGALPGMCVGSRGCVCWDCVYTHTPAGELHVQELFPEGGGAAGFTELFWCLLRGLSVFELREQGVCRAVEFGHPPAKARAELVLPAGFKPAASCVCILSDPRASTGLF